MDINAVGSEVRNDAYLASTRSALRFIMNSMVISSCMRTTLKRIIVAFA